MYGLIISGVKYMITEEFGEEVMAKVMELSMMGETTFSSHERYSERIAPDLLRYACDVTGKSTEEIGHLAGRYFVKFISRYGYGELMQVMGRRLGDFLKGLDNLHEYFRFSYPKIRPPSFYCDRETTTGLTLHYRSRRHGYTAYVMGQLSEIALIFYGQEIDIRLVKTEQRGSFQFTILKISFDNSALAIDNQLRDKGNSLNEFLPVDAWSFLSMFPFFVIFNKKMEIFMVGNAMNKIMPDLAEKRIDEEFELLRPLIKFTWDGCKQHLNNIFKMESTSPIHKQGTLATIALKINDTVEDQVDVEDSATRKASTVGGEAEADDLDEPRPYLETRGPIVYLKSMEMMVYLPTVSVSTMDELFALGLFLDDYSTADCNREIIMASAQKSNDLQELLQGEKEKSRALTTLVSDIDVAKKQARDLLGQMMPRDVARQLLISETGTVEICQSFDEATIAFAKVIDFNGLTSGLPAMEVVNLLNHVYSTFDDVITRHGVYKVETIGECYMISCGIPIVTPYHAEYAADTALDMIKMVKEFGPDVIKNGKKCQIKIGMYSGPCVGGVVGHRAPRYCLFGDTVNCSSRMESHNKTPMTIQLGEPTKASLQKSSPGSFRFESRGKVNLKGKGEMDAFGLLKKSGPPRSRNTPLVAEEDVDSEHGDVYTPVEDRGSEAASRESQMSRMSISGLVSGGATSTLDGSADGSQDGSRAGSVMSENSSNGSDAGRRISAVSTAATVMMQQELETNLKKHAANQQEADRKQSIEAQKIIQQAEASKAKLKAEEAKRKASVEAAKKAAAPKTPVANGVSKLGLPDKKKMSHEKEAKDIIQQQADHKAQEALKKTQKTPSVLPSIPSEEGTPEASPPQSPVMSHSPAPKPNAPTQTPLSPSTPLDSPHATNSPLAEPRIKTKICALM